MKFSIKHEIKGRIRIHIMQKTMSYTEADTLQYYLTSIPFVTDAKVNDRTCDAIIVYTGSREGLISKLVSFTYSTLEVPETYIQNSGRALNDEYFDKLVTKVVLHYGNRLFIPYPVRACITTFKALKYIKAGLSTLFKRKLEVPVLDATAISVSLARRDISTAGSVMFLLGIGEILEEWTHKKSVGDLARSMSLNINKVWLVKDGVEVQVPMNSIVADDRVVIHMGNVIPFDGVVVDGDAMVNQASFTGEAIPVHKSVESSVYAGTVLEDGEITISVKNAGGNSRYERIVNMIEESEKLKSDMESKAEHLADKLVPYTLLGTGLTYLLTRNVTKALSVLMVDFSCALKLAMPITVLSAIREASSHNITVKGGRFLELIADADTIVFDKTGTLTKAEPTVVEVVPFCNMTPDELLKIAACLEEHFPHSMAKAVVDAANKKHLVHEEMHTKVEYIVAHGISTTIEGRKAIIGSHHFVFDDEQCTIDDEYKERFDNLPLQYSHLYLAIDGKLCGVICIEDPLRKEAGEVIGMLKDLGISKVVMMTGDSERTAAAIASVLPLDEYYSEVLPEDKSSFVEKEKKKGRKVIMIGDGVNDSPALSAADVGIAISDGAELAREIADITVGADDLYELITLKKLSNAMMHRIKKNYHNIVGFNSSLIGLGVLGVIPPTTSALFHNASTLMISLNSMKDYL